MSNTGGPNIEHLLSNTFRALSGSEDTEVSPTEMINRIMNLSGAGGISPSCDVAENEEEILVYLDVPGIDKNTVDVDIHNNKMVVTGTRNKPYDLIARRNEIRYGDFQKRITLPMSVTNRDNVKVNLKNGVLKIRIDKVSEGEHGFHVRLDSSE